MFAYPKVQDAMESGKVVISAITSGSAVDRVKMVQSLYVVVGFGLSLVFPDEVSTPSGLRTSGAGAGDRKLTDGELAQHLRTFADEGEPGLAAQKGRGALSLPWMQIIVTLLDLLQKYLKTPQDPG